MQTRTIQLALAACACVLASRCDAMGVASATEQESIYRADALIAQRKSMEKSPGEITRASQQAVNKQKSSLEALRGGNYVRPPATIPEDPFWYRPILMIAIMLGSVLFIGGALAVYTRRALSIRKAEYLAMAGPRAAALETVRPVKNDTAASPKPKPTTTLQAFVEARKSQILDAEEVAMVVDPDEAPKGLARKVVGKNQSQFVSLASLRLEAIVPPKPAVPLKLDRPTPSKAPNCAPQEG